MLTSNTDKILFVFITGWSISSNTLYFLPIIKHTFVVLLRIVDAVRNMSTLSMRSMFSYQHGNSHTSAPIAMKKVIKILPRSCIAGIHKNIIMIKNEQKMVQKSVSVLWDILNLWPNWISPYPLCHPTTCIFQSCSIPSLIAPASSNCQLQRTEEWGTARPRT